MEIEEEINVIDQVNPVTARETDDNGWIEVRGNPISKVGVFPYSGSQIGADPSKIYNVFRSEEELSNQDTIDSFKLIPWIDEHVMLGGEENGLTPPEQKGIEGVIGEEVYYKDGVLYGNIKVFSNNLADLIESGKRQLSAGYRCIYEMVSGVWNGIQYDAIQRNIRGNHLALVQEGRMGPDVAVLDHFKFTFDTKELQMADEIKNESAEPEKKAMTLEEVSAIISEIMPQITAITNALNGKKNEDITGDDDTPLMDPGIDGIDPTVKGLDEDEDEKKEDKKEGMDSAAIVKKVIAEYSARDNLANRLSAHIGTFDCADKTLAEVAAYGVKKLGISCPRGSERVALEGFLHNRTPQTAGFALDTVTKKVGSKLDAFINNNK